jgi:hypothetical protein
MVERDEKGRFKLTTGAGRYKRIEINGKKFQYHRWVYEQKKGPIPKGFVVHHKNGNRMDNRIKNLELVDHYKHNKIHAHEAWNKGKKCSNISKSKMGHLVTKAQIKKCKETWAKKRVAKSAKFGAGLLDIFAQ